MAPTAKGPEYSGSLIALPACLLWLAATATGTQLQQERAKSFVAMAMGAKAKGGQRVTVPGRKQRLDSPWTYYAI